MRFISRASRRKPFFFLFSLGMVFLLLATPLRVRGSIDSPSGSNPTRSTRLPGSHNRRPSILKRNRDKQHIYRLLRRPLRQNRMQLRIQNLFYPNHRRRATFFLPNPNEYLRYSLRHQRLPRHHQRNDLPLPSMGITRKRPTA